MGEKPKVVVAQSVSQFDKKKVLSNREKWATISYYYPQYTLQEASQLSWRDINLLLKTANRIQAEQNLLLLNMISAPHTEKGKGYTELAQALKKITEK